MLTEPGGPSSDTGRAVALTALLDGTAYRAVAPLGEGGMGEVIVAEHRALGHQVVVKVLREELAARPDMQDRMRVEGQALARIRSPHLVMVTDFGHTRTRRPFLVMELLSGVSLHQELSLRRLLPISYAVEIARQILIGLSAVHDAGIIHRDIKPDNIFLCAEGPSRPFVKVLDFGVAKIVQAGRDGRTPAPLLLPTADNVALGTPRYFSPEQAIASRDLDARSDLYSVGLLLYRMLAGHGPFDHYRKWEDITRAHIEEPPLPLHAAAFGVPLSLDRIVMQALAKSRDDRHPDAKSFALELSAFLGSFGPEERFCSPKSIVRTSGGSWPADATQPVSAEVGPEDPTVPGRTDKEASPSPAATAPQAESYTDNDVTGPAEGIEPPRKLSDGPVIMDNMVERILGDISPRIRPVSERSASAAPEPMRQISAPPAPPRMSGPSGTDLMIQVAAQPSSRSPIPKTAPMLDVALLAPAGSSSSAASRSADTHATSSDKKASKGLNRAAIATVFVCVAALVVAALLTVYRPQ